MLHLDHEGNPYPCGHGGCLNPSTGAQLSLMETIPDNCCVEGKPILRWLESGRSFHCDEHARPHEIRVLTDEKRNRLFTLLADLKTEEASLWDCETSPAPHK